MSQWRRNPALPDFEFGTPRNFLGLPPEHSGYEHSRALLLPIPYEATTSYGQGTRNGPQAILDASRQVELYDMELYGEPALEWGLHTLPFLAPTLHSPQDAIGEIEAAVAHYAASGKLLGVLGGEHALSVGVARGLRQVYGDFVTVQMDAHADLRDEYEGSTYSHACAARRIAEFSPVTQLGIRSLDKTEADFLRDNPKQVLCLPARVLLQSERAFQDGLAALAQRIEGKQVFLTLDVDVFDPAIMPSTGTPEPGGLSWQQVLDILHVVTRHGTVIGFDCVEFAPISNLHAPDFLTAKLVYKIFSLILHARQ